MKKAHSTILMIMLLVVTLQGFSVSDGQTSSNDKILVSITKNSVVYLSSQDRMVRAHVEIQDYSPVDGELFMKIVKKSTGEIVSESKIYVRPNSEDIWSTEIGYVVDNQNPNDSDSLIGFYEIHVGPENGSYEGSATFQVLLKPIPGPKIQSITAADPTDSNTSYSNGDTITVVFSEPTNQPIVATKADLGKLFSFSQNLGDDYTGIWTDPSTLVINIVDSKGATPPAIGSFRITIKDGGDLTNAEGTSLVSTAISPVLVGTFGTTKKVNNEDLSTLSKNSPTEYEQIQKRPYMPPLIDPLASPAPCSPDTSLLDSRCNVCLEYNPDGSCKSSMNKYHYERAQALQDEYAAYSNLALFIFAIICIIIAVVLLRRKKNRAAKEDEFLIKVNSNDKPLISKQDDEDDWRGA